jgi:hypothetical protein
MCLKSKELVDCQKKLEQLKSEIKTCSDYEEIDDIANRHVAQCSAENIMLWCHYLDHFSLNQSINQHLASQYHIKRVKRFSESFFIKDFTRKHIIDIEPSENYQTFNDLIKQSDYFQLLPYLQISCDDLDGLPEQMPIIFEENYISSIDSTNSGLKNTKDSFFTTPKIPQENCSVSADSTYISHSNGKNVNKRLHKKNHNEFFLESSQKKSITLVSYKKKSDDFADHSDFKLNPKNLTCNDHKVKISQIKADLNKTAQEESSKEDLFKVIEENQYNSDYSSLNETACDNVKNINNLTTNDHAEIGSQLTISNLSFEENSNIDTNKQSKLRDDLVSNQENITDISRRCDISIQRPIDFSLKSRVLYDSFRGKMNTLERRPLEGKYTHLKRNPSTENPHQTKKSEDEQFKHFLRGSEAFVSSSSVSRTGDLESSNSLNILYVNDIRKIECEFDNLTFIENNNEFDKIDLIAESDSKNKNKYTSISNTLYK